MLEARTLESSLRLLTEREDALKPRVLEASAHLRASNCGYSPTNEACLGTSQTRNTYNFLRLPDEVQCLCLNKLAYLCRRPCGKLLADLMSLTSSWNEIWKLPMKQSFLNTLFRKYQTDLAEDNICQLKSYV